VVTEESSQDVRPWSARKPQNLLLSAVFIVLAVALVMQGLAFIREGVGGLVPYLIILCGPAIAGFYIWYFTMRKFGSDNN
jgi:drug/metabolite transporter (DMT)-like permease